MFLLFYCPQGRILKILLGTSKQEKERDRLYNELYGIGVVKVGII
ncbi:hypothetical protein [Thermococcus litoralis]|nr:hypothetical protein [Thermococcus litoralis]